MAATQKAVNLIEAIAEELARRLPALAQTKGQDSALNPQLVVGTGVAGAAGCYIRCIAQPWTAKNVLGMAADVFSPHVLQVVFEANPAGGAGADINTLATVSVVLTTLGRKGTALEVYQETNGAAPGEADIVPAKLQVRIDPMLEAGMIANQ